MSIVVFDPLEWPITLSITFFAAILICLEIGYRFGVIAKRKQTSSHEGIGAIEGSVFALLGLLIAFTFSGATSRLGHAPSANRAGSECDRNGLLATRPAAGSRPA